jgi:enoyl-CoA hydratase/carnithine racemase
MHQITIPDPGEARRLDDAELSSLRDSLKDARKAPAILLAVEGDAWAATRASAAVSRTVALVHSLAVPVVCHASGRVSGAGLALALACDVRLAGPGSAWGLGDPAEAAGVGTGASWLLRDRVGSALLDHLTWTGELLTAESAAAHHLVSGVGEVSAAAERAEQLAGLPATTVSALKRGARGDQASLLAEQLEYDGWLHRLVETAR